VSETYDLFQQGRDHLRAGRPSQAAVALEKAKRREPEKASIREALGIAYFRVRRWSEAEAEFRKLVELAPADPFAHRSLARTLDRLGRHEDAAHHHALGRALDPER
jgi:Flp pilus assembly protein TadD